MQKIKKAGIVCCSDGQRPDCRVQNEKLAELLAGCGIEAVFSRYIYASDGPYSAGAQARAEELMKFCRDNSIDAIFDISGGDLANEILEYLDYDVIARSGKQFWGYSDLTSVINAVYARTQNPSVLYQIRNIVYDETQLENFRRYNAGQGTELFEFPCHFIRGSRLDGIVTGGNIRCLLKLAGTPYFPDTSGKILFLEAMSGGISRMAALTSQLKQMGVFDHVKGILLGTFTQLEQNGLGNAVTDMILEKTPASVPILKTDAIGHSIHSKALRIGHYYFF